MINISNLILDTTVYDILMSLREELALNHIDLLHDMKPSGDNIMVTCPSHKDGQETKPSCGIHVETGVAHCFTCGYTASLPSFIGFCFGREERNAEVFGIDWLKRNFMEISVEERPDIKLNLRRDSLAKEHHSYVPDMVLDQFRYTHPYMYKRKLTDEIIDMFDVGFDKETNCITFPVRDINGNCLFVARRAVETKWFNYPANAKKPLYGLYEWRRAGMPNELIVCESIFNCLTCWTHGNPAIALNGTGSYDQIYALGALPVRSLVLCLDPDDAGRKGISRIQDRVKNKLLYTVNYTDGRDINDLTYEEYEDLMKTKKLLEKRC